MKNANFQRKLQRMRQYHASKRNSQFDEGVRIFHRYDEFAPDTLFAQLLVGYLKASVWAAGFVRWYNFDHRHSGIRYVSPAQRHAGDDLAILAARHDLYIPARQLNPARWSGNTRNWASIGAVTLNPERDAIIKTHLTGLDIQPLAA